MTPTTTTTTTSTATPADPGPGSAAETDPEANVLEHAHAAATTSASANPHADAGDLVASLARSLCWAEPGAGQVGASAPSRVLIAGPKHSGKSHVARTLCHQALLAAAGKRVAFLDADVDLPEFTCAGLVSLHCLSAAASAQGAPHEHLRDGGRCYYVGQGAEEADPQGFLLAVQTLVDHARRNCEEPLIVHTSSKLVSSLGRQLLEALIHAVQPTHIIELVRNRELDSLLPPASQGTQILRIDSARVRRDTASHGATPLLSRTLRLVSYFDQGTQSASDRRKRMVRAAVSSTAGTRAGLLGEEASNASKRRATLAQLGHLLAEQTPYVVGMDNVRVVAVSGVSAGPGFESLMLNCSLVGLGVASQSEFHADRQRNSLVPCVGLGFVRAVDRDRRVLYIVTPVPFHTLRNVNTILVGVQEDFAHWGSLFTAAANNAVSAPFLVA